MKKHIYLFALCLFSLSSCEKFLDAKPDQKLQVPNKVQDLQSLMEPDYLRRSGLFILEAASDNYYLTQQDWETYTSAYGKPVTAIYTWDKDGYYVPESPNNDWNNLYSFIGITNVVLEGLDKIEKNSLNQEEWDTTKGNALFFRSQLFLDLASIFSLSYDEQVNDGELGIVLRTTTDPEVKSKRSSVSETYLKICDDLIQASKLLPNRSTHQIRPCKAAAYGLLARTYLYMRKYNEALHYADECLRVNSQLMDYNSDPEILPTSSFRFQMFNKEIIYHAEMGIGASRMVNNVKVDTILFDSYTPNDLRKSIFFREIAGSQHVFTGHYSGTTFPFNGLAVDEMYLIRAECYARGNKLVEALSDLNSLCIKRYDKATFIPFSASNSTIALQLILNERRKELVKRGVRWMDIKRLNKEGANIVLTRKFNPIVTLSPNSPRYAIPIPEDVIRINGIPQNPR